MKFVDRKNESKRLHALLEGKDPSFVVVRGRRRLGKSTLIKRVLKETDIYYEADKTGAANQRLLLSKVASQTFPGLDGAVYNDWETLLWAINYRVTERITLCLDEFPYMVDVSPELPSVIQKLLDSGQLRYNLIICGSSQMMMYDLVYDERSPLYGHSDSDFKFNAINISYLQEALHLTAQETIEEYALWGGVPRYWALRERYGSGREALRELLFSPQGVLLEEPQNLFRDDVKDIVKTATIMSIVGGGAQRMKEIASRLQEPATNLSRPVGKLIDLGYLEKEVPFGESIENAKKTLYKVADPFMSFHFRFVAPNKSFIELERMRPIDSMLDAELSEYMGHWWEKICRQAITGNMWNGVLWSEARRWWGSIFVDGKPQEVELDVVAESLDHKKILIGECKWTSGENAQLLTNRLQKIAANLPFVQGKEIVYCLFLKTEPDEVMGNHLLPEDVLALYH